jgi:hypothetical protein
MRVNALTLLVAALMVLGLWLLMYVGIYAAVAIDGLSH